MERARAIEVIGATIGKNLIHNEQARARGRFTAICKDRYGNILWQQTIENLVTTEGKNSLLDTGLGAVAQITPWYIGLISSVSWSAVNVADTAAQINGTNGWKEAGLANAPTYTGNRMTAVWSAAGAGSKALSAALAFAITGAGTVKGCFLVSSNTKDGTTGKLYSAGTFTGGDQVVANTNTLNVNYTASL